MEPVHDELPQPHTCPKVWIAVGAVLTGLLSSLLRGRSEAESSAEAFGAFIGAGLAPVLLAGIAWAASRNRPVTITVALACVLLPFMSASDRDQPRTVDARYRQAFGRQVADYNEECRRLAVYGGGAPDTLVSRQDAERRLRDYRSLRATLAELSDELRVGKSFAPGMDVVSRAGAWKHFSNSSWYKRTSGMLELHERIMGAGCAYVGVLAKFFGEWKIVDGGLEFSEKVPEDVQVRFDEATKMLSDAVDELERYD